MTNIVELYIRPRNDKEYRLLVRGKVFDVVNYKMQSVLIESALKSKYLVTGCHHDEREYRYFIPTIR